MNKRCTQATGAAGVTVLKLMTDPNPDNPTRSYTYDFRGNKLTETDQLGRVTRWITVRRFHKEPATWFGEGARVSG
jgi:YD repeat-containing protein